MLPVGERLPGGPSGLGPGMMVKDQGGRLKLVTRIGDDKVYWRYQDGGPQGLEAATDYSEFADTHFVTPMRSKP